MLFIKTKLCLKLLSQLLPKIDGQNKIPLLPLKITTFYKTESSRAVANNVLPTTNKLYCSTSSISTYVYATQITSIPTPTMATTIYTSSIFSLLPIYIPSQHAYAHAIPMLLSTLGTNTDILSQNATITTIGANNYHRCNNSNTPSYNSHNYNQNTNNNNNNINKYNDNLNK